jgi:hypothetical protein
MMRWRKNVFVFCSTSTVGCKRFPQAAGTLLTHFRSIAFIRIDGSVDKQSVCQCKVYNEESRNNTVLPHLLLFRAENSTLGCHEAGPGFSIERMTFPRC